MTLQYDIEQYEDIKNGGFAYDLSEDTITIVNQLAEQVGAPSYNKTPVFENKEYKNIDFEKGKCTSTFTKREMHLQVGKAFHGFHEHARAF